MKALAGRVAGLLARTGILAALEALDRSTDRVGILVYHRVDEPAADPDLDPGLVSATPADFREQMELLAARYHVLSLDELIAAQREGRPLPRRSVMLTFDDGYRDFAEQAWPVLRRLGLPALLFVPTRFPDAATPGFWWDRLHAALARTREPAIEVPGVGRLPLGDPAERRAAHRALRGRVKSLPHAEAMALVDSVVARLADVPSLHRVLGWDALRALAREGLSVCSHSEAHALYTRLSSEELMRDLAGSKARIEAELGASAPAPVIAYPANACDGRVFAAVEAAGYRLAFGGRRGVERMPLARPFDLLRLPVLRYPTALFRAQLRPFVSALGGRLEARRA